MKRHLSLTHSVDKVLAVVARTDDGTRIDLTGLTGTAITWRLAIDRESGSLLEYTLTDGIALTDAAQGEFSITIDGADLDDLDGDYVHECLLTVSSVTYRPIWGNVTVERDIE